MPLAWRGLSGVIFWQRLPSFDFSVGIVYWLYMIDRFVFVASLILLSFPFVGVYNEWKMWVAFGLGAIFFIYSVYRAVQYISEKHSGDASLGAKES